MKLVWLASASGKVQHAFAPRCFERTLCGKPGGTCFGVDGTLPRCKVCAARART